MAGLVGVVGNEHKDGVLVPRLAAGALKEAAQRQVGVAHALVDGLAALVLEGVAVLLGQLVRVMRRCGEHRGEERLLHAADAIERELQERLVPDGPLAVEIVHATILGRLAVFVQAVVMLITDAVGIGAETHRDVVRPVEESAAVALTAQHHG